MWLLAQRDRVATQTHRVDTRGESLTKSMRRSCVEHLTETLSPQTEIWRLLLATKFQNEVWVCYLARAKPRFTAKVVQDQEPEELSEEWKTEAKQWLEQVKRIPLDKRIYEDETPVYANEAPKKGRSRRGKLIFRTRSRYAKKCTLHMYAKRSGVVHWDLSDKNADTNEIERVAREAVEQVEGGETLIWDRLGRSGRASHPTSQHYSPEAQAIFKWQQSSSCLPKASASTLSNCFLTTSNRITFDRNFCKMVNRCRSANRGLFESMSMGQHQLRCEDSSVPKTCSY